MRQLQASTMTAAEVAAWESMIRDGTFRRLTGGCDNMEREYAAELRRRAQRFEREVRS